jgi:hypothetical protein
MAVPNTLAYYDKATITEVKSFIAQALVEWTTRAIIRRKKSRTRSQSCKDIVELIYSLFL